MTTNGDNNVVLIVDWKGMFMAYDREIQVWFDGVLAGSGSFNEGFNLQIPTIEGVHKIYVGHSIVQRPASYGNVMFIDTGAYTSGKLSIVDISNEEVIIVHAA